MTTTTATSTTGAEHRAVLRMAERTWRRAGVLRRDRGLLRTELSAELAGAQADGHDVTSVLGEEPRQMLLDWAAERGLSGRALRLHLVVPAALAGIVAGTSLILAMLYAAFQGWSDGLDPGRFALALYASGGVLGYLCALVCVGSVLWRSGDPHATSTVRRLASILPAGAALCTAAGIAVAASRDFTTTPTTFVAVLGVVIAGLVATVSLARSSAIGG